MTMRKALLFLVVTILPILCVYSQGYAKDSLQIKVYTEITYTNNTATEIVLKKVFCDYCSEIQHKAIGEEALRRAEIEKYAPYNRLENGIKRIATYIRVSKKDFTAIDEKENDNNN